jgi:ubiquinone/menaquinone biosynthesis C-methylase UbiE
VPIRAEALTPPSTRRLRRLYDLIGRRHDWAERYEGRAKALALEGLRLAPGQRVLNVGAGTGIEQRAIVRALGRSGPAVAVDVSPVMLRLVRGRTGSPVVLADARRLPFADGAFDRLLCSYVLDLLPEPDLKGTVEEFARVIRAGGLLALVAMSEGTTPGSRLLVGAWKTLYRVSPMLCGGCRPVALAALVGRLDLQLERSESTVQLGVPSQILILRRLVTP